MLVRAELPWHVRSHSGCQHTGLAVPEKRRSRFGTTCAACMRGYICVDGLSACHEDKIQVIRCTASSVLSTCRCKRYCKGLGGAAGAAPFVLPAYPMRNGTTSVSYCVCVPSSISFVFNCNSLENVQPVPTSLVLSES